MIVLWFHSSKASYADKYAPNPLVTAPPNRCKFLSSLKQIFRNALTEIIKTLCSLSFKFGHELVSIFRYRRAKAFYLYELQIWRIITGIVKALRKIDGGKAGDWRFSGRVRPLYATKTIRQTPAVLSSQTHSGETAASESGTPFCSSFFRLRIVSFMAETTSSSSFCDWTWRILCK